MHIFFYCNMKRHKGMNVESLIANTELLMKWNLTMKMHEDFMVVILLASKKLVASK